VVEWLKLTTLLAETEEAVTLALTEHSVSLSSSSSSSSSSGSGGVFGAGQAGVASAVAGFKRGIARQPSLQDRVAAGDNEQAPSVWPALCKEVETPQLPALGLIQHIC
jgi:hypothetical protein